MARKYFEMFCFGSENNCYKIIVIVCIVCFRQTCASDFFIAKKYKNVNYVCVTNSSYPMSWVQEDITTRLSYKPFFIPVTNDNKFDSSISLRDPTTTLFLRNPWTRVPSSVDSEVNGIILDRRWEELETYMTESVRGKGTLLNYTTVLSNLREDFEIPFSIRLKQEGHVFLCDGNYPPNSNCYWLLLQAWGGNKTAIRKCNTGYIPSKQEEWAEAPCSNILQEKDHMNNPDSRYFSNKKWSHLRITKKGNVLSLFLVNNKKDERNIITLKDQQPIIRVTHMIIHSKQVNGLWKIHNMEFIYTTQESTQIHLGNLIHPKDNYLCISLFIAMCTSCSITLTLQDYHRSDVIEEKVYKFSSPGWSEIKFTTENIKQNNNAVKFSVSTSSSSSGPFWAIDDIRLCQRTEFRVIALTENAKCQLMSHEDDVLSLSTKVQRLDSSCSEDTIGDFCVPCTWVFDSCQQIEVCQKDKCVCSAGYQLYEGYTGKYYQCYGECDLSYYGHGCSKSCLFCPSSKCNHIDGTCKYTGPCLGGYTGPKCNIRPALIFKKPPEITKVDYSEAIVIVKDFTIEKGIDEEPGTYFFQYKHEDESNIFEWNTVGSKIKFNQSRKITIRDLDPGTKYFVRAVIVSNNEVSYEKSYVKFSPFETLCDELTKDDITPQPSNTSAIILKRNSGKLCDFYHYNVQAASDSSPTKSVKDPMWRNRTAVYFDSLKEFTRYTVTFRGRSEVQTVFQTTEGIPDPIWGLKFSEVSARTVEIQWSEPNEIRGNFEHYIVEYGVVSYLACRERLTVPMEARLKLLDNVARVNDLTPYATYSFSVSVANAVFESSPVTREIKTEASDTIGPEEIPTIGDLAAKSNLLEARLNTNCEKIRGPLMLKASAVCSDKWCDTTRNPKTLNILTSNSLYLESLSPFSNYTLYLQFCRNETYCSNNVQSRYFKTQPAAPSSVDNLLVYSKNENSVSLRWTPPYPPNGILEKYYIQYYKWSTTTSSKIIEINQCALWSNFHCATIDGLESYQKYTFYVQAQNKEPAAYGGSRYIIATANKEAPQPPYDLTIDWSAQNDLELKWKHPNESNGEITCFNIQLNCGGRQTEKKLEIVDNMYKLIYNYTIESTEVEPSKTCDIYVSSDNGIEGSRVSTSDTSPPAIPELEGDLQISDINNKTATVTISPKKTNDNVRFSVLISEEKQHEMTIENLANFNLIFNCSVNKSADTIEITIGDNLQPNGCESTKNPPLQPATEYTIAVQLINTYAGKSRSKIFMKLHKTTGKPLEMSHTELLGLLVLLFIPIAILLYIKRDKVISWKNRMLASNRTSTEVLELNEDQIPLSQNTAIQKKTTKKIPDANPSAKIYSKPIKITEFEEYVRDAIKNGELERQHALFSRGQTKPWTCGSLKENKSKNRYNNLIAYDHSRVVLAKIDGNPHSDYINANYIDGHKLPRAYIATQGPKVATLDDFWRMIWQENVRHIANLANIYEGGKKKLEKYWPDINETIQYGKITVQHLSTTVFADFEHRFFNVTYDGETRKVDQLHFSSWPDHGVPLYSQSLVPFLQKILQMPLSSKSPIVVHCSAGVGRTGTILLCDICLRMAARDGSIDVLRNLQLLREQRANMVDNIEQYKLAHLVVLECLVGLHTSIECSEIAEGVEKMLTNGSLSLQMRYLKDTQWQDQAMKSVGQSGVELPVVQEKNRFEDVIPEIQGCIMLPRYPPEDESSVYINAVKVDGFRSPGRYIVTQQPMPNTLGDFWRLIDDNDICVIISLNEINAKDQTSCKFWPSREKPTVKPVPYISLKYVKTIPSEYYDVISIHLMSETRREHLLIQIVAMKDWPSGVNCPNNMEQFLAFWEESDSISRQSHPVVVTCYDGVTASGLYVAMSFVIEKMKLEQVCDVCQAVRTVRHNREQFVQDIEQFEFLYRAAVLYIGGFKPYANFN